MINSENHITLKNINYSVNNKSFFKNLSTDISTNGITVILGPNGSGKTLLTKIIKGLIKPESGELSIKLNGTTPNTGYLSQNIIFLRRNVFNNLAYPLEIKGFNKKIINKRIEFLLKYFGKNEEDQKLFYPYMPINKFKRCFHAPNPIILKQKSVYLVWEY